MIWDTLSRLSEIFCNLMTPICANILKVCFYPWRTKSLTNSSQPISTSSEVYLFLFRVRPHLVQNFCCHSASNLPLQLYFNQYEYLEYSYPTTARVHQVKTLWSRLCGTRLKHEKANCWYNRMDSRHPYFLKR